MNADEFTVEVKAKGDDKVYTPEEFGKKYGDKLREKEKEIMTRELSDVIA